MTDYTKSSAFRCAVMYAIAAACFTGAFVLSIIHGEALHVLGDGFLATVNGMLAFIYRHQAKGLGGT